MKTEKPGATVPTTGIYWCTVCKTPEQFTEGGKFPACRNMCGKGYWELVEEQPQKKR
jgi:hypothetical protein